MDSSHEPNDEWGFEYTLKQAKETHHDERKKPVLLAKIL
jgi:hypothetical protein